MRYTSGMNRVLKRIIIGIIFVLIVAGIGYGINYLNTERPTCSDGVKNGEEEGVDCGALACGVECPPVFISIELSSQKIFKISEGDYDFVVKLSNPNDEFGTAEAVYDLILFDENNNEIYRKEGVFYILPGQTKFLVETSLKVNGVVRGDVEVKRIQWEKLDSLGAVNFSLVNQEKSVVGDNSELIGVIFNDSDFDFDKVDISIILTEVEGSVVVVNKTNVRTLLAHTERQFIVRWPLILDFQNLKTTIEFNTNLFLNSNFIKKYGAPEEKFQQYY